jgi:gamma-glutamyltranspeptidase/glutathione hydrolase
MTISMRSLSTSILLVALAACSSARTPAAGPAGPAAVPPATGARITDPSAQRAESREGVVAAATPDAAAAGARVLAEGGNAVDAAVAIGFALAVTEPSMSGLGGRASFLVRLPDGTVAGLDGLNQVPAGYKPNSGVADVYERAAIPGVPATFATALARHGTWPLARVLAPAIALAEQGFILGEAEAERWAGAREELAKFGGGRGTYLKSDGTLWKAGERVANPLLAATLRRLAADGVDGFYRGALAAEIDRDMAANGGFIRAADLAAYQALPSIVARGTYRGHQVVSNFRPAAGHAVVQALQMLEQVEVPGAAEPARWAAVVGQAMQLAIADRGVRRGTEEESAAWLTSLEHASERARLIAVPARTVDVPVFADPFQPAGFFNPPGTLITAPTDREATTHYSAVDRDGRVVAMTQSLGPSMGTRLVASNLGFLYATRLGAVPGSRPGSTIAPTIVTAPDGQSIVALGGAGDSRIISAVIQVISRLIDHQMPLAEAMAAPRVHPDAQKTLRVEDGPIGVWSAADRARLEAWGFTLIGAPSGFFGRVHAVRRPGASAPMLGVAEPRWTGGAAGPVAAPPHREPGAPSSRR